jgi:hypothetical protein
MSANRLGLDPKQLRRLLEDLPIDISAYQPFLNENENQLLWTTYQVDIDETRYLLNSKF